MMKASLFLSSIGNGLCSPFFDSNQLLYAILQNDGEIIHIDESTGHVEVIHRTNGQPQSAIYENGIMYIADLALNSISNSNNSTILSSFEELPLKGPHSIIACNNRKYFTDSGPFGETGLHNPSGSIFSIIDNDFSKPIPISLNNLAFPTGIVFHNGCLYVAEMMGNRILRFTQKPEGVHHGSVFIQLSGSIGPSCLACDTIGNIYIGQFDFKENTNEGTVLVVSKEGILLGRIIVSGGSEISGLAIKDDYLYITETSTGSIFRCDLWK